MRTAYREAMVWDDAAYRKSFLDWMACAVAGSRERAARAAAQVDDGLSGKIVAAGTAGHVLDFDDTFLPGIAHLSAPTAPAALFLGAEVGARAGTVLEAYARGFEAMGALAKASHPALYDGGWHPTSVCGVVGAATAASVVLDLGERAANAVPLALVGTAGMRGAFGSDGKSLQVGMAAAAGVRAARLAAAGAVAPAAIVAAFEESYGATWAEASPDVPAVGSNWIKAYPCCLQTHGSIEAAERLRAAGVRRGDPVTAVVHPVSRQAARYDDVVDGLQAKFSIPYTIAFTLAHGPPGVADFERVDPEVREAARRIVVHTDRSLMESEAVLEAGDGQTARVDAATGSPRHPMTAEQLAGKVRSLAGARLDGCLDDLQAPASDLAELVVAAP